MKLRKYIVYVDEGERCFKAAVPAEDEAAARDYVRGNGEIIAVKDITEETPISLSCVAEALLQCKFGATESDLILRTLADCGIAE